MTESAANISRILSVTDRSSEQNNQLFQLVQKQFRGIASRLLRNEKAAISLQETILVHDSFLQLIRSSQQVWETKGDFFARAAQIMRHLLVDHARRRLAQKRGEGKVQNSLESDLAEQKHLDPQALIELNDLLEHLQVKHPEAFKVFDLHYFMGHPLQEIANEILDTPYITIRRRWKVARAFLREQLIGDTK